MLAVDFDFCLGSLRPSTSQQLGSDTVRVTVAYVDMIAYRPQTEVAGYNAPFKRTEVPFAQEEDPGVYIRRNGDDDNNSGTPDRDETNVGFENDLIEVSLNPNILFQGTHYLLRRSSPDIQVWTTSSKTAEIFVDDDEEEFSGVPPASVWVEWVGLPSGATSSTLTFEIKDTRTDNTPFHDDLEFHPFNSIVVVLGGRGQAPSDPPNDDYGIFKAATDLYAEGYDVHMYNEDQVVDGNGHGAVYDEVLSAIEQRGVSHVAIMGYSWGGGATFDLSNPLNLLLTSGLPFTIDFTAYVDAVVSGFGALGDPQTNRPAGSQWHLNIYQPNGPLELGGGPMPSGNPGGAADDDIDATVTFGADFDHYSIDNDPGVRNYLKAKLKQRIPTR